MDRRSHHQKQFKRIHPENIDIIVKANHPKLKEDDIMSEALKELFDELFGESYEKEKQQAIDSALAEKDAAFATTIAQKDARIAELEALLASKA